MVANSEKKIIFDLIFDLFDIHENPGSIFRFMSDFGCFKIPYILTYIRHHQMQLDIPT